MVKETVILAMMSLTSFLIAECSITKHCKTLQTTWSHNTILDIITRHHFTSEKLVLHEAVKKIHTSAAKDIHPHLHMPISI